MSNSLVVLHHGDCRKILPTLDPASIGAVVTDPPYGIDYLTSRRDKQGNPYASWTGQKIAGDQDSMLRDWIVDWSEGRKIPWAVFGSWKCRRPDQARGILIWDKGPGFGMGDLSFPWKMSWEAIYVGGDGWFGRRDEGVLRGHMVVTWESHGRVHPSQKPVSLMSELLKKLPPDLTILDPFAGSGSTGVACMKAGRRCTLIELDPNMIPIIRRRLAESDTPLLSGVID